MARRDRPSCAFDFEAHHILVRSGKGAKDRVTVLPATAHPVLERHLVHVRELRQRDLAGGAGWVELPCAVARNYPNAGREWPWQWLFPATRIYTEPQSGQRRRHHLHETALQRAVHRAVREAGIAKPRRAIRSGTRSPHISSNPDTTSGRSKSSSATATSERR